MTFESWMRGEFTLSTDPEALDFDRIHRFLAGSYWAAGIPRALVEKSIRNSLAFGLFHGSGERREQIGFARVITDRATFAYLADVYVEETWRGRGLSKWMLECVFGHADLQGLRRFCLGTRDAHGLYARFGFQVIPQPENWMEIRVSDIYRRNADHSDSKKALRS